MGLQLTTTARRDLRKLEILPKYFTFPVQLVGLFVLKDQGQLEGFIDLHKKLLRWWLGKYVPSYVKDLMDNADVHPLEPEEWKVKWQEAVAKCGYLDSYLPVFWLTLAHRQHWREPADRRF